MLSSRFRFVVTLWINDLWNLLSLRVLLRSCSLKATDPLLRVGVYRKGQPTFIQADLKLKIPTSAPEIVAVLYVEMVNYPCSQIPRSTFEWVSFSTRSLSSSLSLPFTPLLHLSLIPPFLQVNSCEKWRVTWFSSFCPFQLFKEPSFADHSSVHAFLIISGLLFIKKKMFLYTNTHVPLLNCKSAVHLQRK